jgi:putative zinc finger protein
MNPIDDSIHPPSEDLFAYRDGELPPEKRALIEAHVLGCSVCRSFVDQVSSLEAELRRTPDRAPSGYLERLHETVRARIHAGSAAMEGAEEDPVPVAPSAARDRRRAGSWRERGRRSDVAAEEGRIRDVPKLPWAAIVSTASAAVAVMVVVVILIKQGIYQAATPRLPRIASRAPAGVPAESTGAGLGAVTRDEAKQDVGASDERNLNKGARQRAESPEALLKSKNEPVPPEAARENQNKLEADTKEELERRADAVAKKASERVAQVAPAPASGGKDQLRVQSQAARGFVEEQITPSGPYEALVRRFGLPPVWDGARVSTDALQRAVPELKNLYLSGEAGRDSARVRLYLAEAARLRYTPGGDSTLFEEIQRHYRRAIALAGPDAEVARVAEERLQSLER